MIFFANTNFVVQCQSLQSRMRVPSVVIVNDGMGMDIAALMVHRRHFAANLNGTDFIPYVCRRSPRPLRLFLLGGKPGVAGRACEYFTHILGQKVVGICDGYGQFAQRRDIVDWINAERPDLLLVAFGNPLQERWLLDHADVLRVPVMMGVGALFDFLAGDIVRAPALVRKLRLEWFFRLCLEPRRLLKRYTLDIFVFFALCLRHGCKAGKSA